MSLTTGHKWLCSLERLDPQQGYTVDNTALVCLEFNGVTQWSAEKFQLALQLSISDTQFVMVDTDNYLKFNYPKKCPRKTKDDFKMIDGVQHIKCSKCKEWCSVADYRYFQCRLCKKKYDLTRRCRPKFILDHFLNHAKGHIRLKRQRKKERILEDVSITVEDIIELYKNQQGRCFYSNIPLQFPSHDNLHDFYSFFRKT